MVENENDKENEKEREKDKKVVDFDELVERIKSGNYTKKELRIFVEFLQTPPEHLAGREDNGDTVWCLRHDIPVSRGYCQLERFNCEYFGNRCMGCH